MLPETGTDAVRFDCQHHLLPSKGVEEALSFSSFRTKMCLVLLSLLWRYQPQLLQLLANSSLLLYIV